METTVTIDGREVKLRATAAVPRLYRIKFRRDILLDMVAIQKALDTAHGAAEAEDGGDAAAASCVSMEALEMFENVAYIMAKHADPKGVPSDPDAWLDTFDTFSIYLIFPVIRALWERNVEALDVAKKKLAQWTGT